MGFLGILEDSKLRRVPGTVLLNEDEAHSHNLTGGLKHGKGADRNLILVPQPSEDSNDPLNWPQSQKLLCVIIISYGALINCAVLGGLLSTGFTVIAKELELPISKIALLAGYQLLIGGVCGSFTSAVARKWGKRPCFLFGGLVAIIGTIVDQCAKDYSTLLAGRMIGGAGIGAWESVGIAMVGDLYFVHERGLYIALMHFTLATVTNLCNIFTGLIVVHLGWRNLFNLFLPACALQIILMYFFVPETAYIRDRRYEIDEIADDNLVELANIEARREARLNLDGELKSSAEKVAKVEKTDSSVLEEIEQTVTHASRPPPERKSFWQRTAIFTGVYSKENFFVLMIAPYAALSNVAVLWTAIVSGYATFSYIAITFCMSQMFSRPPYNLSASGVGYLFLGAFIGGCLGTAFMSWTMDPLIRWCTRKNKGIYEPEYRLIPTLLGLLAGAASIGFGQLIQQGQSYYATATLHGVVLFGVTCVLVSTASYILDAYREISNESFIIAMIVKQFFFFSLTTFINASEATRGPFRTFTWVGVITLALCATTPAVFVCGKRYRGLWHRHNILDLMHINTHAGI